MQTLANANARGFFYVTQSALELDKFFVNALANATAAEVIVDLVGTLQPGQTRDLPINVAGPDRNVTFILTWDNAALKPVFDLVSPSAIVMGSGNVARFDDLVTRIDTSTYALARVDLPVAVGPDELRAGPWRMRVRNPNATALRFAASAITASDIVSATTIEPSADGVHDVGETFTLTTFVKNDGEPVSDATVTVTVKAPVASLGSVLAAVNITPLELSAIPTTIKGEPISQLQRLTMALTKRLKHDPIGYQSIDYTVSPVPGQPGLYQGRFEQTRVTGPYTFTTRVKGRTKDCEVFTREAVTSAYIPQKTDGRRSNVDIKTSRDNGIVVHVTPAIRAAGFSDPALRRSSPCGRATPDLPPRWSTVSTAATNRPSGRSAGGRASSWKLMA